MHKALVLIPRTEKEKFVVAYKCEIDDNVLPIIARDMLVKHLDQECNENTSQ